MRPPTDVELQRGQSNGESSPVQQAVCVRKAHKRYGTKINPCVVLDDLNMTVPKGAIYGLLGASGCGKTTLLNCVLGRKHLDSGELWVLGGKPGTRGSGVPGPRVGYMPQDLCLYEDFTIRETLKYFGWISGMTTRQVEDRLTLLVDFLMLPDAKSVVKNLSGGQQRRVSLATALLHEPELLILDEPTVGVDPILRQNIWTYLLDVIKDGRTTVILTTHYIDEAKQAHLIGLMRGGYLLAEESPECLISHFGGESLEDVFLKLSVIQNMGKRRRSSIKVANGTVNEAAVIDAEVGELSGELCDSVSISSPEGTVSILEKPPPEVPPLEVPAVTVLDYFRIFQFSHVRALVWKNFLWMWRNAPAMAFIIGLPMLQTLLFCFSIGHDPTGLPLSIVNYELEGAERCKPAPGCNSTRLSCQYLTYLENRTLQLSYYSTEEAGKEPVRQGKAWAALVIPRNFSQALRIRIKYGRRIAPWDLVSSTIDVYQDKSNENIGSYIQRDLYYGFEEFFRDYLQSCNINNKVGKIPFKWEKPVYGYGEPDFTDFAAPGFILTVTFFLALALTAGGLLIERKDGTLERGLVNGINANELLIAHIITQFLVLLIQITMVLIFSFAIFGLSQNGNLFTVIVLVVITGFCGMCFGFAVGTSCDNERSATIVGMGSFFPIVFMCGIIWPIEAMHKILKAVAFLLPLTKSTESLRCILARGWSIDTPEVYGGFISTFIWIFIFLTLSVLFPKIKNGLYGS